MNRFAIPTLFAAILVAFATTSHSQTPSPTPTGDDEAVKITTKIIQMDVLVLDKDGAPARGLGPEDFEIFQDGKKQRLTGLSFIDGENGPGRARTSTQSATSLPAPAAPVRPGSEGRLVTFVVDDGNCSVSQVGMVAAREALEKYIKQQMQPNDLVAIYRTRGGSSFLQQYTNDKQLLLRAAAQVRWLPPNGECSFNDGSMWAAEKVNTIPKLIPGQNKGAITIESDAEKAQRVASEDAARNNQPAGALGLVRYVVRGLERVPGRKVVFFMSDGLPLRAHDNSVMDVYRTLQDLTELANRSSVVFDTIDVRGLVNPDMIEAADDVRPNISPQGSPLDADNASKARAADFMNAQDGLSFLAKQTGGEFYHDNNYLDVPIRKAMQRERGYYLVAYEPEGDTFKGKKFNKIEIRVTRPGLRVVARSGFMGIPDEDVRRTARTGDSELYEAIAAPLPRPGLEMHLTAFYMSDPTRGNIVRALVHIAGSDIRFQSQPDGRKKAVFDVVAVTMNEKNQVVDEFNHTHSIMLDERAAAAIASRGLIYAVDVPVKKPGVYSFRTAVRDEAAKMIGSASQAVIVPDLAKRALYVTGLTMSGVDAGGRFLVPGPADPDKSLSIPAFDDVPAIRRFAAGSVAAYSYYIFNAKLDAAVGQPKLAVQTNLYKDGELVLEGKLQPADLQKQPDLGRLRDFGYLRLAKTMPAGVYTLQLIVKDLASTQKNAVSSQSIDFEIVP